MAKLILTIEAKNENAIKGLQALEKEAQALSKSLSSIKVNKDLTAQINALTKNYTAVIEAQTKLAQNANKQAAGIETTRKGYANLISTLKTLKSQYAEGVFGTLPEDAEKALKEIENISEAYEKNGKLTQDQAEAYANLSKQLKKYSADLAVAKAKNDKIVAANPFTVTQAQQIPRLIKQYSTLLNTIKNTEKYYPKGTFDTFKADLTQGQADLQALNNEFLTTGTLSEESQIKLNNLANSYNQLNASIAQTTSTMKSSKGTLKDIVSGFFKFQLSAMLVMKPLQWIRSALSSINETLVKTEDAVIALQRVLPSGSATDSEISSRLYKIAADYGQTFENVSQIATNFARTGMSWADTIKATEAAVLALNVAELDAEEATTGLIAILSQFNLEASDLETVIDKLNKTADNFPVTTEKILAALQRTGSAASNANLTLDQTIALITALSQATGRSGENIGTALNSLIQYSSKASALDTFAALSDESAAVVERFRQGGATILDVWRQVSEEIKSLKSDQADLLDQYFNTEDGEALKNALDGELQDIYTELSGVYDTANTFRKNYFIALLGNMDTVEQALGTLGDAAGYSQKENEKYLNTYTAKLNKVKAQWEDIANSEQGILGIKKALVDVGSVLLTIIKWTGGLRTLLLAISTVVWALVGNKILAGMKAIVTAIKGLISGLNAAKIAAGGLQAALGAIGTIATVISLIVGLFEQLNDNHKNELKGNLSNALMELSELSDSLSKLEEQYKGYIDTVKDARSVLDDKTSSTENLEKAQNSLLQLQSDLIRNNKDYNGSLDLVNGSLDEQLKKIKEIEESNARQQVKEWLDSNADATYEAKKYLRTHVTYFFDEFSDPYGGGNQLVLKFLQEHGYNAYADIIDEGFWNNLVNSFGALFGQNTLRTQLNIAGFTREDYVKLFKDLRDELETSDYTDEERDYLRAHLTNAINFYEKGEYQDNYNLIKGDSESSNWIERLTQEQRELFVAGKLTLDQIYEILGIQKQIDSTSPDWHNDIAKVTGEYDDLIDKLKELRDAQKESLDLEEKKKNYLEAQNELIKAQQALENARNEATVRRYNETTGQWEWQVDEKKIAEAEEAVKAQEENVENARKDLEDQAYDAIIDMLENKTAANEGLNELLDGLKDFLGEDFIRGIKEAFASTTGVDLDKPTNNVDDDQGTPNPNPQNQTSGGDSGGGVATTEPYDNGGAAFGKGLMRKETKRPETVIGPDLTAKILSPVSNDHFHRYVRDMGLLFETSRQYAQAPVVERVGGAIDNRVDNSGQIIMNGVSIGADKRGSSLDEILALGGIVSNE